MECPKCKSNKYVKDGIIKSRQRYLCKVCNFRYTVEQRGKPIALKKAAVELYLEGMGYRGIERVLKVSNVSVMNWIKAFGKQVEEYRKPEGNIDIIELDELHTYVASKKTIVGSGFLLIGLDENSLISCLVRGERKPE
jgi:transposase-like protein